MIYRRGGKRAFDIMLAIIALFVVGLILIISIITIRLSSPGPVFFLQNRAGLNGKIFKILKLRTMTVAHDREASQTTNADPEVFPVGAILRRTKIDELPQLINILKGDMSFVGPRPCLVSTRDEMPPWARRRFEVRPGLTGRAQINGNIALSWEERWKFDVAYVEHISLVNDLRIILKTFSVVIFGEERFKSRT